MKAPSSEDGFILVTVLIVIALLFPLVLAFNSRVQLNLIQAENFRNSVQAVTLARSGVEGAIGILKIDDPSYDAPKDLWASGFPSLSLGEGILAVHISEEDGKIPVNRLIKGQTAAGSESAGETAKVAASKEAIQTEKKADEKTATAIRADEVDKDVEARLRALITRLGGNPDIVDALIDWLDSNDETTGNEGAEEDYYRQKGYHCKNGPLDSLDELLLIRGFDKELVIDKKLRDYLTVAQTDGKINVNFAPLEVLYAVLGTKTTTLAQPLSEADIEDFARYREEHQLNNVKDVMAAIKISQDQFARISPLIKVNSSFFTVNSRYTIGRVVKNVEALVRRSDSTVVTVSWRES